MNRGPAFRLAVFFAFAACATSASAAELALKKSVVNHLGSLTRGQSMTFEGFPVGPTRSAAMRLERVDVYAPDAHIYVITAKGREELPRSNLVFLRGYADDDSARVALAFNPDGSFAHGTGSGPEGSFVVGDRVDSAGTHRFSAKPLESTLPRDFKFDFRCGNESGSLDVHSANNLARQLRLASTDSVASSTAIASHALRFATVAVDTDVSYMTKLFSGNTTSASNWIANMFNVMNTMYERDLLVRLFQGNTTLRTSSDPYDATFDLPPLAADGHNLDIFGNYWMVNNAAVSRSFALLLSGVYDSTPSSCSASGIAWINQYCQKGFTSGSHTVGSYSVNEVCTSASIDPNGSFAALLVGHELGHNFGAAHTHCTDTTSGASNVATNTIDTCYNGESGNSCYAGATSCPSSGPGAPAGTIMSYCNVSGCGPSGQNVLQFHPTQINQVLMPDSNAAPAGCLNTTDDIFYSGME